MVDKIDSHNTWRQITSSGRVKKVKQRPDYDRDQGTGQNRQRRGPPKKKMPGESAQIDKSKDSAPGDLKKKTFADADSDDAGKKKDRRPKGHGKLIDIVV
jgi:hypothetical protein